MLSKEEFSNVSSPKHYAGNGVIECKDALRSMLSADAQLDSETIYWWGCSLKYLWRWPLKNGIEDIDKAIQCLQYMKESRIENGQGRTGER